jgi:hypothetical protein
LNNAPPLKPGPLEDLLIEALEMTTGDPDPSAAYRYVFNRGCADESVRALVDVWLEPYPSNYWSGFLTMALMRLQHRRERAAS